MPCLRHRSATFMPASASFSTPIICSSVNRDFFMTRFLLRPCHLLYSGILQRGKVTCTMRTALSRDSGENLFDLFMAPSSQRLEPPQNPGRFTHEGGGFFL